MMARLLLIAAMTALGLDVAWSAEKAPAPASKASYAALESLPDWKGIWTLDFASMAAVMGGPPPALKGKYKTAYEAYQREVREKNGLVAASASHCRPPGMPIIMMAPQYPLEFLFTPGRVTTHHEAWMQWRVIYTDGRTRPEDVDPTFNGFSTGRWEGDTLVVETSDIKTSVDLSMGVGHSGQARIVERIHLKQGDADTLVDEMVISDPQALGKPWSFTLTFKRSRDAELLEFVCEENDRNPVDASGHTRFE